MTQPTTERDRVKQRVAKLLNVTLDKGASENEAMMAAEKAAELMSFYDIEASELSVRSARAIKTNGSGAEIRQHDHRGPGCPPYSPALRLHILGQHRGNG